MPFLGAHLSIAGGLPRAVARAVATGCEALQIFTKSTGQWRARPLPDAEIAAFRDALARSDVRIAVAHASYLINVAAADPALRVRSMASLTEELDRADALGLAGLVLHPGSASDPDGLHRAAGALGEVLARRLADGAKLLIEHTAGQGSNLGHRFEHLAALLDALAWSPRVGVCLDTCHLHAAGYGLAGTREYRDTFRHFDHVVGLDRLRVVHVNDSRTPRGSRVDRHQHIGEGHVGRDAFARLVNDRRFARLPMILETEKACGRNGAPLDRDPLDVRNLETLRALARGRAPRTRSPRTAGSAPRGATRPARVRP